MFNKLTEKYKECPVQLKVVFWFTIVSFFQKGISVVTTPVFTRILTTEQYGMFSVYNAWSNVLVIIITLNLHMSVINNAFMKKQVSNEKVVSSFQGLSLCTSLFFLLIYLVFRGRIDQVIGLPSAVTLAMFISFIFIPPYQYWVIYNRYRYDYKRVVLISGIISVMTPLCAIAAIYLTDSYKGEARILGKIFVVCISGIIIMVMNWKKSSCFFDRDLWKYALLFNLPLIPHFLSEILLNESDRIMINKMCGTAEAGIYSIAYMAGSLVLMFSSAVNAAMVPWQYEKLREKNYLILARPVYLILAGLGGLSVLMVMFAPEVILILAGEKYIGAISLIPTLAASVYFNYLYQTLARVEMYFDKKLYTVIATITATVVNIVINLFCIPIWGYIAAGYSTLIAHIVLCIMHYIFYRRVCNTCIEGKQIFSTRLLCLISLCVLLASAVMTFLYEYLYIRIGMGFMVVISIISFRKQILLWINTIKRGKEG